MLWEGGEGCLSVWVRVRASGQAYALHVVCTSAHIYLWICINVP